MTVKCANNGSNGKLFTKHQCPNNEVPCELDQVVVHMTFFVATQNKNEYFINTHGKIPQRAMYQLDENHNKAGFVLQLEIDPWGSHWEVGSIWKIEEMKCDKETCPVFVRAAERPDRGYE